ADQRTDAGGVGPPLQRPLEVVRHQSIFRVARDEEIQDPCAGEAREVPQLRAVPAVPWVATEGGCRSRQVSRAHDRRSFFYECEIGDRVLAKLDVIGSRLQSDRKSTRLNSSHVEISYAVFCLKKKKKKHK